MVEDVRVPETVTWPELFAVASLACDTGMGLPLETGLGVCLVSLALGETVGLGEEELTRVYRLAMLEHIGCTAAAPTAAAVVGDELVMREHAATLDFSDQREMFRFMLGHVARVYPTPARPLGLFRAMAGGRRLLDTAADVCEAGQMLGRRCGYDEASLIDLERVYENWDGSGFPAAVSGDAIPVPVQIVQVATLAVNAERTIGAEAASALLRARRGRALAPGVVDAFVAAPERMFAPLTAPSWWDAVVAAEPGGPRPISTDQVDDALAALGDFADLKAPCLVGHSSGVARLVDDAAGLYGLGDQARTRLRRAAWVHDIGRVTVSSGVWTTSRPLTAEQREQVRMHPYYTQRVLSYSPYLRALSETASCHHERLDGSGYFRGAAGVALDAPARLLAAADLYRTKREERPHRAALDPDEAAAHVRAEVAAGRLDALAAEAVLSAAGSGTVVRSTRLTPREIEILVAVARGGSTREIARRLTVSPKTVDGHLQRIYPKIGVGTRGGATLYALEHGLLAGPIGREEGENSP
jgi:HD-GYP domain-containing protein (c-di-GMP phosphodiesterase class II)